MVKDYGGWETSCLGPSFDSGIPVTYIASRIGSAVLTAPVQVFQGIRNDYYTQLLFYAHKQTTMVMLFAL